MPDHRRAPQRIVFVGWGAIASRVAQLLHERGSRIELVGIATRTRPASTAAFSSAAACPDNVRWLESPDALAGMRADLVIEAAGRAAVEPWGVAALEYAGCYVVSSTSAFCDETVLQKLIACAERHGSQIVIPPGALAAIDALAAAAVLPVHTVTHRIVKPPAAWIGTPAETLLKLDSLTQAEAFFEGTARDAARLFPANANVAVIAALAGIGLDKTRVALVADPHAGGNGHHLHVEGDFGVLDMKIENRPLATNPKSSELTALALVRIVENRTAPLCV